MNALRHELEGHGSIKLILDREEEVEVFFVCLCTIELTKRYDHVVTHAVILP